ncbi:bifunctional metallophosphatase/5'-nucleotidase [Apilactobacillus sp. TMW 2.2459]|uniref:bifunctional metallophosphatase/5'-nucleotidase n=1 Tax=Apilactobacillus xinyiensis TaxID=2841032 RepID=UPI002010C466|nr:bifunctional UDP-sugar hydrolase/5'-nucleotidase [Apilactobacillus xinyiensis]MCL0312587.1 bifunctional metallophosphatase/5'-nucleotidase [Apilactobacillus xinyiensis]
MKINILTTSDTHGFVFPTNYVNNRDKMPFGMLKAATCINSLRKQLDNVVTIDNGDFLEGSPLAYYIAKVLNQSSPKQIDDVFNMMHYDYGILGNHEFNYGVNYLRNTINESNRKFLCANILNEQGTPAFGKAYDIKNINGIKVGFLGLTTQGTNKWANYGNLNGLKIISAVAAAKKYIPIMKKNADIIVVSYHGGFERDFDGTLTDRFSGENESYQLLKEVKGIDALVTGHQHRKIAKKLFGVPVVQEGRRGQYVGKITLDVNTDNKKVEHSSTELVATGKYSLDQVIKERVNPIQNSLNEWLDKPLAKIDGCMKFSDPFKVRLNKNSFIQFVQKVQMDKMGVDISATALFNNEAHGFENPITMRNIITNYVYPNSLSVLEIDGKDLKQAIEISAKYFSIENNQIVVNKDFLYPKVRHYNYDMYEGIDYVINVSQPVGSRVEKLTYHGKEIDKNQKLRIVLNQYRASGGGHFPMFSDAKIIKSDPTPMSQVIAEYLKSHKLIKAENNHNFKIIKK